MTKFFTIKTSQPVNFCNGRLDGAIATQKFAVGRGHGSLGTITRLWDGILPGQGYAMQDHRQGNPVQGNCILPFISGSDFIGSDFIGSDRVANRRDLSAAESVVEFLFTRYQLDRLAYWQRSGRYKCREIVPIQG
ncbi:MAG TPA: hypothetical protein V6C65_19040 [Allocoleopsis sp.]